MNWLDRFIAYWAPGFAARRVASRLRLSAARAYYDGATVGRRGASIRRSAADSTVVTRTTLPRLRAGARDLVRNNPHAKRAVEAIVSNTIGTGIQPQFMRGKDRAEDVQELARLHLETTACDPEGRQNYHGLVSLAFQAVVEGGEVLVRRRWRRANSGLPVPVQFQVLEGDYLDHGKDGPTASGGQIVQGVEYDAEGRRRAYWLFSEHPGSDRVTNVSRPVPARDITHVFRMDRPGQVRGITWFAPVMLRLADFMDYEDAQLVRQKIAACFVGFVKESFDGLAPPSVSEDADGNLIDKFEPGILERLPPGTEIQFGNPPEVDNYDEYTRVSLRAIAAGMGISYTALTGDLTGVNFSSGKMGHIEFQRNISRWQSHIVIPQLCDVLTGWFLDATTMVGVDTEGVTVRHIPPRREMIDPAKEIPATTGAIRSGQKTLTEVIRERGRDPVEHLREYAEDLKLLDELGITLVSDPRADVQRLRNNSLESREAA